MSVNLVKLSELGKERRRWQIYIYPESRDEAIRLAALARKTIGQYIEDLIAEKGSLVLLSTIPQRNSNEVIKNESPGTTDQR